MNRILLAAPKSGSGKTMITCGIITLLKKRGLKVAAFKCGPDYIDPMFHRRVLGVPSGNLDTYFTEPETLRFLLKKKAEKADVTVIEGVMGYYDGLGGVQPEASAYDVARLTETPVVLVIDAKGASLSLVPLIKGLKEYKEDSNVRGVILNRISGMIYERLKAIIEEEAKVRVLGYVPEVKDLEVPSRHLGLVAPDEVASFQNYNETLAAAMKDTLDVDGLIALSKEARIISGVEPEIPTLHGIPGEASETEPNEIPGKAETGDLPKETFGQSEAEKVKIGVAFDEAFSFYYSENFELMEQMGAEVVRFSPLADAEIPQGVSALVFGGGYPEIYANQLSENQSMLQSIREKVKGGMPCLAECGGFMYLNRTLKDGEGTVREMTGILDGDAFPTNRLGRFGYIEAEIRKEGLLGEAGEKVRGHEFHYWDCTENGDAFHAEKPVGKRGWDCMIHTETLAAGFPHFYFYNNPDMLFRFLLKAKSYANNKLQGADHATSNPCEEE